MSLTYNFLGINKPLLKIPSDTIYVNVFIAQKNKNYMKTMSISERQDEFIEYFNVNTTLVHIKVNKET